MCLFESKPPPWVSHHLAMFGGHWPGASRDAMYLTCHVNPKRPCDWWKIMWLSERKLFIVCLRSAKFGGHMICGSGNTDFNWSCDLERPNDEEAMWFYWHKLLKLIQHPVKFGDHRHCGGGDIMVLVCHIISQKHQTKGPQDFKGGTPSSRHPAKFGGHRHCGEDVFGLSCDLTIPLDQTVMWLYGWEPFIISNYLVKFGGHRHCHSGDVTVSVCHGISQGDMLF